MRRLSLGVLAGAALALGLGAAACSSDDAAEKVIEDQTGGDIEIDSDDGSVSISGKDGEFEVDTGEGVDLPSGFPSDVPLPEGGKLVSASKIGESFGLTYTADDADEIISDYKSTLEGEGYEVDVDADIGGVKTFSASNGTYMVAIGGGTAGGTGEGGFTLTVSEDPDAGSPSE